MHTDIIKLKKQKHSQQLQQPLVILLKTHSQDSDQQNDCNIQSGAPTQILLSGPPDPILRLYSCVVSPHQTLPSKNGARPQANLSHCPPATDSRQLPSIPITPAAPLMHFNRKVALVSSLSLLHLHKQTGVLKGTRSLQMTLKEKRKKHLCSYASDLLQLKRTCRCVLTSHLSIRSLHCSVRSLWLCEKWWVYQKLGSGLFPLG